MKSGRAIALAFYRELGAPELGFLLVCSSDFPMAEGFGEVELTRTQTIITTASTRNARVTPMRP